MLNIDNDLKDRIMNGFVQKSLIISFPGESISPITDEQIVSESMEIQRSIMDGDELRFGGGIAAKFRIRVFNVSNDLTGKNIKVALKISFFDLLYPADNLFPANDLFPCGDPTSQDITLFTGVVDSALRQKKNRSIKEIVAFDRFYSMNWDGFGYMTDLAAHSPTAQLCTIRDKAEEALGFASQSPSGMFNDSSQLSFTVAAVKDTLDRSVGVVELLAAYCELNTAFAMLDNDGQIQYVRPFLSGIDSESISIYSDLEWEEYETDNIDVVSFSYGGKDNSYLWGNIPASGAPCIYKSDNILTRACSDISSIVNKFSHQNILGSICKYRPFTAKLFDYWWLEPGDKVSIATGATDPTDVQSVNSYVFDMTITGIQNIRTVIKAGGKKTIGKKDVTYDGV